MKPEIASLTTCSVFLAVVGVTASCSCGKKPQPLDTVTTSQPGTTPPVTTRSTFLDPQDLGGHWRWSHIRDGNGVRRIESEHWHLVLRDDTVSGHYDRTVTFLSLDGVPFECSQALSYRLETRYQLIGTADTNHLEITERSYEVGQSPCERGFRRPGHYTGKLNRGKLILGWEGGTQKLSRAEAPPPMRKPGVRSAAGSWRWHNRSEIAYTPKVRVETEEWELAEGDDGTLTGTYLRTVTVFDAKGRSFECAGDSHYQYRDRYTIAGARQGSEVTLTEVSVDADDHPCVTHDERHLDSAVGTLGDGYLHLVWRGHHEQILRRSGERAGEVSGR